MSRTRPLQEMLARLDLTVTASQLAQLERLAGELLHWNRKRNLTAIVAPAEVEEKHLLDSLTLLPWAREAQRMLDLGSGAGFPALPIKVACPQLAVVSVDAVGKKISFQRHVARQLGLEAFEAVHARAEELAEEPGFRGGFDLVTARALTALEDLVALAEPFLASGGCLVAMKGAEALSELADCRDRLIAQGWLVEVHALQLPVSGAARHLVVIRR